MNEQMEFIAIDTMTQTFKSALTTSSMQELLFLRITDFQYFENGLDLDHLSCRLKKKRKPNRKKQ